MASAAYWKKRTLDEEAKVNQLAGKMSDEVKSYLQTAYTRIERAYNALAAIIVNNPEPTRTELYNMAKYKKLMEVIEKELGIVRKQQTGLLDAQLKQIFEDTIETAMDDFEIASTTYSVTSPEQLEQTVRADWQGSNYSDRVWNNTNILAQRLKNDITQMIVAGTNPQDIIDMLRYDFGVAYNVAERLIRTEASHAYNTAALESYKRANVKEVQVLEAKDEKTCEKCKAIAGIYKIGTAPLLPIHCRCRCCYVPVVKSEEQELLERRNKVEFIEKYDIIIKEVNPRLGNAEPYKRRIITDLGKHGEKRFNERKITSEDAQLFIDNAIMMIRQTSDKWLYISQQGAVAVTDKGFVASGYSKSDYKDGIREIIRRVKKI